MVPINATWLTQSFKGLQICCTGLCRRYGTALYFSDFKVSCWGFLFLLLDNGQSEMAILHMLVVARQCNTSLRLKIVSALTP